MSREGAGPESQAADDLLEIWLVKVGAHPLFWHPGVLDPFGQQPVGVHHFKEKGGSALFMANGLGLRLSENQFGVGHEEGINDPLLDLPNLILIEQRRAGKYPAPILFHQQEAILAGGGLDAPVEGLGGVHIEVVL